MILKHADGRSADIAELNRLMNASPPGFRAAIQKQIQNILAGAAGERDAAHFLDREFGSSERIAVLHDLRLGVGGDYAQIDHLVIHRFQGAAWVLETKNYSGRLGCDEHGDWTVWRGGKPTSIPSPVNQARRQCETLRLWLAAHGIGFVRTIHPVVLISPSSSMDRRKLPADAHVVKSDNFGEWRRKQADGIGVGAAIGLIGRHMLGGMSQDDFKALGERLASAHVPIAFNWRDKLRIPHPQGSEEPRARPAMLDAPPPLAGDPPRIVPTPHGEIRITRVPDGRYALRNDKNDALIEAVRSACKGRGQWNPRYRNWLVQEGELSGILAAIASPSSRRADPASMIGTPSRTG